MVSSVTLCGVVGCQPIQDSSATHDKKSDDITVASSVTPSVSSDVVEIAASAALEPVLPILIEDFSRTYPNIAVKVVYGNSLTLYEAIRANPKQADVFLSSNESLPRMLYHEAYQQNPNQSVYGKPFAYTRGQLVLYSVKHPLKPDANSALKNFLVNDVNANMVIANPQIASYGLAAERWLTKQNLLPNVAQKLNYQPTIDEAFKTVDNGLADFGLVSLAQVLSKPHTTRISELPSQERGDYMILPKDSYPQIFQSGLIINAHPDSQIFVDYLLSAKAQDVLGDAGYLPVCVNSQLLPACK